MNLNNNWSAVLGNASNNNTSLNKIQKDATLAWKSLSEGDFRNSYIVTSKQKIIVSSEQSLQAFDYEGNLAWKYTGRFKQPILLDDNNIACIEDKNSLLTIRDEKSGAIIKSTAISGWPWSKISTDAYNNFVFLCRHDRKPLIEVLDKNSLETKYKIPLEVDSVFSPIAVKELLIIPNNSHLLAVNSDGEILWKVNQNGFIGGGEDVSKLLDDKDFRVNSITNPLILLDDRNLLVGFQWYTSSSFFIIDIQEQTIRPFKIENIRVYTGDPVAIWIKDNKPFGLATMGAADMKRWLFLLDFDGNIHWRHETFHSPKKIIADSAGTVIFSHQPPMEQWDLYKDDYNLYPKCFVRAINTAGETILDFCTKAPILSNLAIGPKGQIYFVADDALWCLE